MHVIPKITASIGGKVALMTAAPATGRVVVVPTQAYRLLTRAGIQPPAIAGDLLDVGAVDAKLLAAGMSNTERIVVKSHLRAAGLLTAGRPIQER